MAGAILPQLPLPRMVLPVYRLHQISVPVMLNNKGGKTPNSQRIRISNSVNSAKCKGCKYWIISRLASGNGATTSSTTIQSNQKQQFNKRASHSDNSCDLVADSLDQIFKVAGFKTANAVQRADLVQVLVNPLTLDNLGYG